MYKLHTVCRACGSKNLGTVADFGLQPLANDFRADHEEHAGAAPLKVLFCHDCTLAQLSATVNPHVLYDRYSYVTSPSKTMQRHFVDFTDMLKAESSNRVGKLLEIGSNNGAFLSHLRPSCESVTGVDPAKNLAAIANENGIETYPELFNSYMATSLGTYDTIVARHVFAHVDDWHDFIIGLDRVTRPDGIVAIEVPYAARLIDNNEFDTIYHEHLSYVSFRAINALLKNTSFYLHNVYEFGINGGSVVLILRKKHGDWSPCKNDNIKYEDWFRVGTKAKSMIQDLKTQVQTLNCTKAKVAGYGAPAKCSIWINSCGFSKCDLEFIHDFTPQKQGMLAPGTNIPVIDGLQKLRESVDYAVLFVWNYAEEIIEREEPLMKCGLKFIVPCPSLVTVGAKK